METMILQTICGAVMVLIGAVIARGWPEGGRARDRPVYRDGGPGRGRLCARPGRDDGIFRGEAGGRR